jgi:hypothetical protein
LISVIAELGTVDGFSDVFFTGLQKRPYVAALLKHSMKPRIDSANDTEARRAAARRTALIVGAIAVFLFVLSIVEVAIKK